MVLFSGFNGIAGLPVLLGIINTGICSSLLYNLYIRSSCWTVLNLGLVILLIDYILVQNLAFYQLFRILISETDDFRNCTNFFSLENTYGSFLVVPIYFSLFIRLFFLKYPEQLIVEGTDLLKFCYVVFSFIFCFWLSSMWFVDAEYPQGFFVNLLCTKKMENYENPAFTRGRQGTVAFLSLLLTGVIITHYRVTKVANRAMRGSIKKVGIRYKRNILSYRQSVGYVINLFALRVVRECVLMYLYLYKDKVGEYGMEIFLVHYFIKALAGFRLLLPSA
ncbi:uncharacterized protein LOC111703949 isoform X2 [Eurytemora carolleeae]|uniref:uncharacterized protein LOC111703949 isoform X2 n=1 Tax=Eurytemora carolleeae TaxID=1294199 RepID=UPI000C791394|nr:uncharacterized protein LOC111703949 isoform X2 [Eurytemora carolleeae]|eukprot:XP_023331814.1 uncharacterized protein LOC111703949 isoform X2 [Eurytemora affinis]